MHLSSRRLISIMMLSVLFAQAVRAGDAPSGVSQAYWVEQLASGLKFPFGIAWLPDGSALITERQGGLRRFQHGVLDSKPIEGVPPSFQSGSNGLKDIVLDPEFSTNQTLYLSLSEGTFDQHHAAVYRARLANDRLTQVERLFRAKDEVNGVGHSSARMVFLPDNTLLIAVPEGHYNKPLAQRLDSHIGKLVRIRRDGSIPDDNPFVHTPGALPEIWAYGVRVPTGIYFDKGTDLLWEVEPGPRGGDELNILKPGGNYGWAKATWGFEYNGTLIAPLQSVAGVEDPVLVWTPSVTPSGLTRYRGRTYRAWDGDFFVGYLSGRALERLRISERHVVMREQLLSDLDERIREVNIGPDNHLYLLTDNSNGRLLRLQPGQPTVAQQRRVAHKLERTEASAATLTEMSHFDPQKGKQAFMERCAACHSVGSVVRGGTIGPDLSGVFGRAVGQQPGFNYSPAMMAISQKWDWLQLQLFLIDPSGYVKGTAMTAPPVSEAQVRGDIMQFLKEQSGQ